MMAWRAEARRMRAAGPRRNRPPGRRGGGRSLLRLASLALVGVGLGACGSIIGGPPPQVYSLSPKSSFSTDLPTIGERAQLVVEQPETAGGLNTTRIAVKPKPLQLDYYAGARWTERAPLMVQTLLLESFENTGKIISVGREALGLRPDFVLRGDLREFQAQYYEVDGREAAIPHILVQFNAKLIEQPEERIFDSRNFESCVRADSAAIEDVIRAFDVALGDVMKDAVQWSLREIAGRGPFRALRDAPDAVRAGGGNGCRPG